MIATAFDEENAVFDPPPGVPPEECAALSVWRGALQTESGEVPVVISCWKPTAAEWEEMRRTGRVWLIIWGVTMPPAALSGTNPFGG